MSAFQRFGIAEFYCSSLYGSVRDAVYEYSFTHVSGGCEERMDTLEVLDALFKYPECLNYTC